MSKKIAIAALAAFFAAWIAAADTAEAQQPSVADLAKSVAELETRVAKLEASGETNTLAIAQVSSKLAEISQQIQALAAANKTSPDLVGRVDEAAQKIVTLEQEVETLRTQLADLEQPYAAPAGGGSGEGFTLVKGDYSATISAYLHARWQLLTPEDFATITQSTFRIRRARAGLKGKGGKIFGKPLRYSLVADFAGDVSLRDFIVELQALPQLAVRVGQTKIQQTRQFSTSSTSLMFIERSFTNSTFRYDRDAGAWVVGALLDDRISYAAGVSNGSGANSINDNIDFVLSARVTGAVIGKRIRDKSGDIDETEEPAVTVGASVVHDLVRLPDIINGIVVMERDVDADEVIDNVRVLTVSAEATLRFKGFELTTEGYFRRESWGTILQHSANEDLRDVIDADANGNKNYFGGFGQASYFVLPRQVAVGARVGFSDQTLLPVGGLNRSRVLADQLLEIGAVGQLYRDGKRLIGLDYTLTNFNSSSGPDPAFDIEHRILLETQLVF